MKLTKLWILAALLVVPTMATAQLPVSNVCDLLADGDGDCVNDAAATSDSVCVQGIVIAWQQFGGRGAGAIYDPVSGCCISVFELTNTAPQAIGDEVVLCGRMTDFAGLAEINLNVDNPDVTTLSSGNAVPCTPVTCTDLADDSPTAERLESCLVQLCVTFDNAGQTFADGSTNYLVTDSNGVKCTVRIDSDTDIGGTAIPVGTVAIKGVLGQFNNFGNNCTGYQVLPRSLADIAPANCTVAVDEATWSDVKANYKD